jgi:hypothetical protein
MFAAACGDPLKDPALLEEPRVLGARLETEGDAERATPRPGERATVHWILASPAADDGADVGWAFAACKAEPTARGVPFCQGRVFAEARGRGEPRFPFLLPEGAAQAGDRLLVWGGFCLGGEPTSNATRGGLADFACRNGGEALRVNYAGEVGSADRPNHNPSFERAQLAWDGQSWAPSPSAAGEACSPEDLRVIAGSKHELRVEASAGDREALARNSELDPSRETLALSHVVSAGELERPWSFVDPEDERSDFSVTFTAPKTVSSAGQRVRFYLGLRDLRGGADFTTRDVCVVRDR